MKCDLCDFETNNGKIMSNHKRWKHIHPKGSIGFEKYVKKIGKASTER